MLIYASVFGCSDATVGETNPRVEVEVQEYRRSKAMDFSEWARDGAGCCRSRVCPEFAAVWRFKPTLCAIGEFHCARSTLEAAQWGLPRFSSESVPKPGVGTLNSRTLDNDQIISKEATLPYQLLMHLSKRLAKIPIMMDVKQCRELFQNVHNCCKCHFARWEGIQGNLTSAR
jgi:hypothetical protein